MFADAFFPTFSVNDLIEMPSSPASSTAFNNSPIQLFEYKFLAAVNFSWLSTLRLLALRAISSNSDSFVDVFVANAAVAAANSSLSTAITAVICAFSSGSFTVDNFLVASANFCLANCKVNWLAFISAGDNSLIISSRI